jgi:hypothetical protein
MWAGMYYCSMRILWLAQIILGGSREAAHFEKWIQTTTHFPPPPPLPRPSIFKNDLIWRKMYTFSHLQHLVFKSIYYTDN